MSSRVSPSIDHTLRDAHDGSMEALGTALEAYRYYLLMVANRELGRDLRAKGEASDLVQETFLEAQRDFPQFRGQTEGEFRHWLRRILLNNLSNFERDYRHTSKRRISREVPLQSDRSSRDWLSLLAQESVSPSRNVIEQEQLAQMVRAAELLSEDYRRVIELRYSENRSFEEIATMMERSPAAARKLWARAVKRLQREIEALQ